VWRYHSQQQTCLQQLGPYSCASNNSHADADKDDDAAVAAAAAATLLPRAGEERGRGSDGTGKRKPAADMGRAAAPIRAERVLPSTWALTVGTAAMASSRSGSECCSTGKRYRAEVRPMFPPPFVGSCGSAVLLLLASPVRRATVKGRGIALRTSFMMPPC
jgi:hypothetical protein